MSHVTQTNKQRNNKKQQALPICVKQTDKESSSTPHPCETDKQRNNKSTAAALPIHVKQTDKQHPPFMLNRLINRVAAFPTHVKLTNREKQQTDHAISCKDTSKKNLAVYQ